VDEPKYLRSLADKHSSGSMKAMFPVFCNRITSHSIVYSSHGARFFSFLFFPFLSFPMIDSPHFLPRLCISLSHRQPWLELRWSSLLMLSKVRSQSSTSANFRRASSSSLLWATSRIDRLVSASSSGEDSSSCSFSLSDVVAVAEAEARP